MSTQNEELKKYISECLESDLLSKKFIKEQHEKAYYEALTDIKVGCLDIELLFKRAKLAKIHYAESLKYYRLWQCQKQLLT